MTIPFNRPVFISESLKLIRDLVKSNKQINIAGDGYYCGLCEKILTEMYNTPVLLTSSCTHALEMAAILCNLKPGDEVIVPSYTFVSTVLPFEARGAKIKFVDVDVLTGNLDLDNLKKIISKKTKVIITVHYAGNSTDMDELVNICKKNGSILIEDAAQAIGSKYKGKLLGTFGDLATISFHETKNVTSGEGGALIVNNKKFLERAKIIREKGTNRAQFKEGLVDKYSWVDTGSSYILSDLNAAYLYPQLKVVEKINKKRIRIVKMYKKYIKIKKPIYFLQTPKFNTSNGHLCAIVCLDNNQRQNFISYMKKNGIITPFHYVSLHTSPYMINRNKYDLPSTDKLSECLVRLPLFYKLTQKEVKDIIYFVNEFFNEQ